MKLRTRLTLGFLVFSLLSMAAVAFLAFNMGREQLLDHTLRRLQVTSQLTEDEFSRWMTSGLRTLESIAQRPQVVNLIQELNGAKETDAVSIVDEMREVHLQPRLQAAEFETLFLLDPDSGEILVSTDIENEGVFREQQPFFQQGREANTVQTIYYSLTEQRPRMTLAVPIKTDTGELVGVLAGHLSLAEMGNIFAPPESDRQSEETYLVNNQGMAISELLYRQDAVLETWVLTPGVEACLQGQSTLRESIDYRGAAVLGSYTWVPEHDLCLITEMDQAEALEPIQQFRSSVILFSMGSAAIFSFLGFLYTGTLAAPVKKMRDVAKRYRRGDLSARMAIPSTDEYAALAHEFNRMAAELQTDFEELERRYQSLFESVPAGLYQSTLEGKFREVNTKLAELLGFEDQEALLATSTPMLYANPSDRDRWVQSLKRNGEVIGFELEVKRRDGKRIWVRHDAHLTEDSKGDTIIEGAVLDITERHRIAAEFLASEARFRSVVQNSQDLITIMDRQGDYTYVSPSMERIFGHIPEDLLQRNAFELVHPEDVVAVQARFAELVSKPGETLNARFRLRHASGEWRTVESLGANHMDSPDISGIVVSTRDITERVRAEQALAEHAEELKRSNEELEQFAYVASHDLQEPLRMVSSYVQLLGSRYTDQFDEDGKEFIHYAVDGAQRMQRLINDLLQFSRVGTRGKELAPVDSQAVLQDVVRSFGPRLEDCQGSVVLEGELPTVMADEGQLHQVFQNLIGNALKFQGDEPPEVHISASRNGSNWRFAVQDNGIGIDSKFADRIFVIFQRLHNRNDYEGTGIGLALAKKIIDRHGGEIWFESEPDAGTTFYFTLSATEGDKNNG